MNANSNPNNNRAAEGELVPEDVALRERIEKRAYHLWAMSGGGHGEHLNHWLQAEIEVLKAIKQEQEERSVVRRLKPFDKP